MSNKKFVKTKTARRDRHSVAEAENEIRSFFRGNDRDAELSIAEIAEISAIGCHHNYDSDEANKLYAKLKGEGKSSFDCFVAARAFTNRLPRADNGEIEFSRVLADFKIRQQINKGMRIAAREEGISLSSLSLERDAGAFEKLGFTHWWEVVRFSRLWEKVENKTRSFCSPYQPSIEATVTVALTPNYNRLPAWVREDLVKYAPEGVLGGVKYPPAGVLGGVNRIGNIWRLPDCVRAWKWCRYLPKGIAERVGRMSVRARILSPLAWAIAFEETKVIVVEPRWGDRWRVPGDRADQVARFWVELQRLSKQTLLKQIAEFESAFSKDDDYNATGYRQFKDNFPRRGILALVSQSTGFPWTFITEKAVDNENTVEYWASFFAQYGDSRTACRLIFGSAGKATVKAFQACQSKDAWKWASAIGEGNADAVQKILGMQTLIAWEPDAVDFLLNLPMVSRLRMLQATEFKYRGQVQPISPDHVRDTGYLWSNIQNKPELGRVRCWFSVHETLAAAFVKELPDEALPIPAGWERVDGLCAVDGSWELEFPQRVATLKYYGEVLHNCVGGYGPAIKSGRSVIFVVREHGILTHCVEMEPTGECRQFYRAGNRSGDEAIRSSVLAALRQAGLNK